MKEIKKYTNWEEVNEKELKEDISSMVEWNKIRFRFDDLAPIKIFSYITDFYKDLINERNDDFLPMLTTRGAELVDIIWKEIMKEFPEWEYNPSEEDWKEYEEEMREQ